MPPFDPDVGLRIDIEEVSSGFAVSAVDRQRGVGERARKGNPKKDALLGLGDKESTELTALAKGLFEGDVDPDEIEERIERSAERR
jgi:hypothetical protein